jgi:hypothetical protein
MYCTWKWRFSLLPGGSSSRKLLHGRDKRTNGLHGRGYRNNGLHEGDRRNNWLHRGDDVLTIAHPAFAVQASLPWAEP